jgi:predicted Zn-dependent protease with MMP-like domain
MILDEKEFETLVSDAYGNIPAKFREQMENVEIMIEPAPNAAQMKYAKNRGFLLGLFEGVPKTAWGQATLGVQPSKITLFRDLIMAVCSDRQQLKDKITEVLMHEVAHYFGYSEAEVAKLDNKFRLRRRGR